MRRTPTLHARLFRPSLAQGDARILERAKRFDLSPVMDALPDALPLGIRQRLSLAVAVIHGPEMLILDEPTSGVDPVARDAFWRFLADLSRQEGVTIFISTHFMNEAQRCDRISLMHAGRVLAQGSPAEVEAAVAEVARTLAPQGTGLLMAPSHRMMTDVPMANVEAMLAGFGRLKRWVIASAVRRCGRLLAIVLAVPRPHGCAR